MQNYRQESYQFRVVLLTIICALIFLCAFSAFLIKSLNYNEATSLDSLPISSSSTLPASDHGKWTPVTLELNDTFDATAEYFGISHETLKKIYQAPTVHHSLSHLASGSTLYFLFDDNHELAAIKYRLSKHETWLLTNDGQKWNLNIVQIPLYQRAATASLTYYLLLSAKQSAIFLNVFFQSKHIFEKQALQIRNFYFTTSFLHVGLNHSTLKQQLPAFSTVDSFTIHQPHLPHSISINSVKIPQNQFKPFFNLQKKTIHITKSAQPTISKTPLPKVAPSKPVPIIPKLTVLTFSQLQSNPHLYTQIQRIFKDRINFTQDIKPSDELSILYDKFGHVSLITFNLNNKNIQAIRYTDSKGYTGYYLPNGQSIQKSFFLSAPLKYKRISEGYTLHRLHPILNIIRPHFGIDYTATAGTPVRAVSSGYVSLSGWYGSYGNTVVIHHSHQYQSLYAHLNHINYQIKSGQWVQQGQIIGYVGSTGLSTGPHLHFGLYRSGKAINPALVLPEKNLQVAVADKDLTDFLAKKNQLLTQLAIAQNYNHLNG